MAESIATLETRLIKANPENPRLIFHQEELEALQESIEKQGILVPLTVYVEKSNYIILDGERRWRCAIKLGLSVVPAIVQPKPAPLQNLMMMFAIHHRRNEWDPLPTALKLQRLEELYVKKYEARPTEKQLAEIASLTRGEVRRYKKLLSLPESYIKMLMEELMKPRSQQILTVDHVLEATAAASSLRKRGVVDDVGENVLRSSIVDKFKSGVIDSTVAPRKLARLARAVEREEVSLKVASKAVGKFIANDAYTIDKLFHDTVASDDFRHSLEQLISRTEDKLSDLSSQGIEITDSLKTSLRSLSRKIKLVLGA